MQKARDLRFEEGDILLIHQNGAVWLDKMPEDSWFGPVRWELSTPPEPPLSECPEEDPQDWRGREIEHLRAELAKERTKPPLPPTVASVAKEMRHYADTLVADAGDRYDLVAEQIQGWATTLSAGSESGELGALKDAARKLASLDCQDRGVWESDLHVKAMTWARSEAAGSAGREGR